MRSCFVLIVLGALGFGAPTRAADPNATARMVQATFKLVNPGSTATCFLVRRPRPGSDKEAETILVTAAHVFKQMAGEQATLVLRKANEISAAAFPVIRRGVISGFPLAPVKAYNTFLVDYNNFVLKQLADSLRIAWVGE